jgi:tRNA (cmo5U34)-methyltransferase
MKSTPDEIRQRFDQDVERFSNLETGQAATIDAPLVMDLVTRAAAAVAPGAKCVLDVGCGAGNYTIKFLKALGRPRAGQAMDVTLIDLSQPMLDRAKQRIALETSGRIAALRGDVREIELDEQCVDVIFAAAVLHHLRGDDEWRAVFAKFHRALRPGGSIWIADLIEQSTPGIQALMWERYGQYLSALKGDAYRDQVYAYVAREDSPRPLLWQIDLLRDAGFREVEILHKNSVFAAFGAIKS